MLDPALETLWSDYLHAEADGMRSIAMPMLERFIEQLSREPTEVWQAWAKQLAASISDGAGTIPVRFQLYTRILAPALTLGVLDGEPGCARWLASLDSLLVQNPPTELPPELQSPAGLLQEAVRLDPHDHVARGRLVEVRARYLQYTLHELPVGVLFGIDGASLEQCAELLNVLEDFRAHTAALGTEASWAELIQKCEFHFEAYACYLRALPFEGGYPEHLARRTLIAICDEIKRRRDCGVVHCGVGNGAASVTDVAQAYGLSADPFCYREVTEATAHAIVTKILHEDLAYGCIVIPFDEATALTSRFFELCCSPGCRFFSNGDFVSKSPIGWNPATDATFDTGVLILGAARTGCVWVEDED